jgi:MoaA/NifB/PqqE/SkfB family radical SAM enzyme
MATRSLNYGVDFVEILYRAYLNHSKIVHFRDGYPVYSLMTPALFSRPAANFISRALFRTIQNRNLPNLMSFAVNDACNASCEHCSFYEGVDDPDREVLTLEQATRIIADAQDLGVSTINITGGEPLLRDDLPQLLEAIDKDRSTTLLFTNGWALEERAADLKRAGLDSIFVSIGSTDPKRHDDYYGMPGLFERAMNGIQRAKQLGFSVGISSLMTRETWRAGDLEEIVEMAKRIGVHEVFVFDAAPTGRYKDRADLVDNDEWTEEMVRWAVPYNQDRRYPGITFHAYMSSHRSVGCACGTSYFYLSPYGDVMSCDFNHAVFGNVLREPLWRVWERLSTRPEFCQAKWGGCKVKDAELRKLQTVSTGEPCGKKHLDPREVTH